jgi:putative pyruvate formate lyase activating enzyme
LSSYREDVYDITMVKNNELFSLYTHCTLCPRSCGVNRARGEKGFCRQNSCMKLACACLHKGEEPPLCGEEGSGTLFFSGCTLRCSNCQNYQLSHEERGKQITECELAQIMCSLQEKGACNINIVTGTHFIPGIVSAIKLAQNKGMKLPVVWNTSGYEAPAAITRLNDYIDVYLVDVKTLDPRIANKLFAVPDYPRHAARALQLMAFSKPLRWDGSKLVRGVILRHLVLPGEISATEQVLAWYKEELEKKVLLSLMTQFIPIDLSKRTHMRLDENMSQGRNLAEDNRSLTRREYDEVMQLLDKYDIEDGLLQEFSEDNTWLPDFSQCNPFPKNFAEPVWHYFTGFSDTDQSTKDG